MMNMHMQVRLVLALGAAPLLTVPGVVCAQHAWLTYRPAVRCDGAPLEEESSEPFLTTTGRYICFGSFSDGIVPGDRNGLPDGFVLDQLTREMRLVSIGWNGQQGDKPTSEVHISEDGRVAVFRTASSTMVPNDTNGRSDIFVRDLVTGEVTRVSVASDGSEGDAGAIYFDITPNARFIAFDSHATNMVEGDGNESMDVFVHDRQTGVTERVSVGSDGQEGDHASSQPAISTEGRSVAFMSYAWNFADGDTNLRPDVFVRDRVLGTTEVVSVSSLGVLGNAGSGYNGVDITPDGRYVAFGSEASNLVPGDTNGKIDLFVRDRWLGITERVSIGTDGSQGSGDMPAISDDGRFVAFFSGGRWDPGDDNGEGDIYVRDRLTRTTRLVSRATEGWVGNKVSAWPVISGDGRFIAFESDATNLVPNDNNGRRDVFVHVWRPGLGSGR